MKDGYYLSAYLHIDELSHLMGFRIRHDQNASLWHKAGEEITLVHYWELERSTRLKQHNKSFYNLEHAKKILNQLLAEYGLTLADMNQVWGTPGLQTCQDYHSLNEYPQLSYHSIAHLFSTVMFDSDLFYNETIIGMAVDGGPDWVVDTEVRNKFYYSGCVIRKGKLEEIFPVCSPGFLWSFARKSYNLREGTLMALGSASESEAYWEPGELPELKDIKALHEAYEYVRRLVERADALSEKDQGILFNYFDPRFTIEENKISIVMKEIHKASLRIMEKNIEDIAKKYKLATEEAYLALSGGYILNCPTNSYLMHKYRFKGFIAPPCVSDCGISLGMALYAFYKESKGKIEFHMRTAYHGDAEENLNSLLCENPMFRKFVKSVSDFDVNQAVDDITEAPVAWFDGRSEVGPRALGNRSILADPRLDASKEQLNTIKQRQWWRPVAPIVLEEEVESWFEDSFKSPFMLHAFRVRSEKINLVPSIAHLDGTARVQTLSSSDNSRLYEVIKRFKEREGIPILCNTSLNDQGEPIVNRIEEALYFSLVKNIKIMYINGKRLELFRHHEFDVPEALPPAVEFEIFGSDEKERLLKKLNPHNVPREVLIFYGYRPELRNKFDISKEDEVRKLIMFAKLARDKMGIEQIPGV